MRQTLFLLAATVAVAVAGFVVFQLAWIGLDATALAGYSAVVAAATVAAAAIVITERLVLRRFASGIRASTLVLAASTSLLTAAALWILAEIDYVAHPLSSAAGVIPASLSAAFFVVSIVCAIAAAAAWLLRRGTARG